MKRLVLLFEIFLFAANSFCYGQTNETKLSASEKAYILSRFCTEIKYNFAFFDKLQCNWDSLCASLMPIMVNTASDEDFVKEMQALCARLHDGHTYIFLNNNPANGEDWIRPFPMKTKRIGDRVFVSEVYSSKLHNSGVSRGCEIIEIDGEKVLDYAATHIQPYLSSSTPQWTKFRPFAEFELTKAKGSKVSKILFRNQKGTEFVIESNRNISWDLSKNSASLSLEVLRGNIGLLKVSSFQDSDFDRALFDKLYKQILETDALIIDIRDNGGGNSAHADYLISHLCADPILQGRWKSPMYIAAHASWGRSPEWYSQIAESILPVEGKDIYDKPIVLLVNSTTFSSAENFCISFKGAKRGKIIGTPTGGSTGNPIFIDLGGGISCGICTKYEFDVEGNDFIGVGIQPDIVVEEDVDLFMKDEDNVVEKALNIIECSRKG
ncbi:MAG: S41 family peptidase [Muribaculaceae bacterium]|nr:S41 family peptidase [Muribaculaceae bacterium]